MSERADEELREKAAKLVGTVMTWDDWAATGGRAKEPDFIIDGDAAHMKSKPRTWDIEWRPETDANQAFMVRDAVRKQAGSDRGFYWALTEVMGTDNGYELVHASPREITLAAVKAAGL